MSTPSPARSVRTLYHVTPAANRQSIRCRGVLVSKSKTKRRAIYVCTRGRIGWAISHVIARHKLGRGDVDVWECDVRTNRLQRVRRGLYAAFLSIPNPTLYMTCRSTI